MWAKSRAGHRGYLAYLKPAEHSQTGVAVVSWSIDNGWGYQSGFEGQPPRYNRLAKTAGIHMVVTERGNILRFLLPVGVALWIAIIGGIST